MRRVGRISGWNDEKGYGFVVPHDGGERAFVHIKAFEIAARRPVDGDLISYSISKDGRGRSNAIAIRFAGQKTVERESSRPARPFPWSIIGIMFLIAITGGATAGLVPVVVLFGYFIASGLSYILYALDKMYATKRMWRVPEQLLHIIDLFCGWPGALVAQHQFRHKTAKASFQSMFWLTAGANVIAVSWLVLGDSGRLLVLALLGS